MNLSTFTRQRIRIERRFPAGAKRERAMQHLVADAEAVMVVHERRVVAWRLKDGSTICVLRRYSNAVAAHQDLLRIMDTSSKRRTPNRIYPCQHCGGFHLTGQARSV